MEPDRKTAPEKADGRGFVRIFLRNPAIVLTSGYLVISLIGVIHSLVYYYFIRINIFEYWEASDVLMAGFRRPEAFLWTVLAFLYLLSLHWLSKWSLGTERWKLKIEAMQQRIEDGVPSLRDRLYAFLGRQTPEERLASLRDAERRTGDIREWRPFEWFAVIGTFLIFIVTVTFLSVAARINYDPDRPPDQQRVVVTFTDGTVTPSLDSDGAWFVVGRTNRFLILYDRSVREPVIAPWESIQHVRHEALGPVGRPRDRDD
jgi:hypothetical protein